MLQSGFSFSMVSSSGLRQLLFLGKCNIEEMLLAQVLNVVVVFVLVVLVSLLELVNRVREESVSIVY